MKLINRIGVSVLIIIALLQLLPVVQLIIALLNNTDSTATAYLTGKLAGHLVLAGIIIVFVVRVLKREQGK